MCRSRREELTIRPQGLMEFFKNTTKSAYAPIIMFRFFSTFLFTQYLILYDI